MTHAQALPVPVPFDLPQYPMPLAGTRGVYHELVLTEPHSPEQQAWFTETCTQVEHFLANRSGVKSDEDSKCWASFTIHFLADALYARLGPDAAWDAVTPIDALALRSCMDSDTSAKAMHVLADFYRYLAAEEVMPSEQAHLCADYFRSVAQTDTQASQSTSPAEKQKKRTARTRQKAARRNNRKR